MHTPKRPAGKQPTPADLRDAQQKLDGAVAAAQQGRFAQAAKLFEQAARRVPLTPSMAGFGRDLQVAIGNQAFAEQRFRDALAGFEAARRYDPAHPGVLLNIGNSLMRMGAFERAAAALADTLAVQPGNPEALRSLSAALFQLGALDRAERTGRIAAAVSPEAPAVWFNQGTILKGRKRLDAAIAAYRRTLALAPGHAAAEVALIQAKQQACDWSGFDDDAASLEAIATRGLPVQAAMLLSHKVRPPALLAAARAHAATIPSAPPRRKAARRAATITVGYLSDDFRQHPVAHLLAEVLALHDRTRFRIVAYSYGPDDQGEERRRIREGVDRFVDIDALPSEAAAEAIRRDGVDILVDLKGYTGRARPEILALRPAPVQVSYLGYPGTMGAAWIDCILADSVALPPELEAGFSEAVARLPGCFLPRDRRNHAGAPPPRSACGLPDDAFVLACFNAAHKITPDIWAVWMTLLRDIPDAVLWLPRPVPEAERNLRGAALAHGVAAERLILAPWVERLDDHLARLQQADLVLDTLHYGAHTTASDALWVGVPMVSCPGETFQSRVGASLLHAAGLSGFVAGSLDGYAETVRSWAGRRAELRALREDLRSRRDGNPVFDMPAHTRALEAAYLRMLEDWQRGDRPTSFTLPA
ncbi:O-linked N-acetylglucosamine transferase, SPINDLY family protein [Azospirillum agricola]|uniref:O-linked N-acetylglucosamine transferase, SPINDLY family protein n=1 Tax=Azospirillum agricola TaxID=1720247 RepID=UPI000A0F1DCC|nr:tetratricopeptide repeat protein [Azospirillum agricola]SMH60789.1 Predicted O-linked N-acetylglucosamine transferase, SPINDLY family [Azospirillum lipoferum]